jgi:hypothetical protein
MFAQGRSVAQSNLEGAQWFSKAADQGYAAAQKNLGIMFDQGRSVAQSDVEAARWFREPDDQGLADAQSTLGAMYLNGRGEKRSQGSSGSKHSKQARAPPQTLVT